MVKSVLQEAEKNEEEEGLKTLLAHPQKEHNKDRCNTRMQEFLINEESVNKVKLEKSQYNQSKLANKKYALKLIIIFHFVSSFIKGGVQPFIAVYMVTFQGWNPFQAGTLWSTREFTQMATQAAIGAFIDHTHHKRVVLSVAVVGCILAVVVVMTTNNFYIHVVNAVFQGVAFTILDPCKAAMTLGVTGSDDMDKAAAKNDIAEHSGTMFIGGGAGVIAYFIYPRVEYIFLIAVVCGIVSIISVILIPSTAINHDVARNSHVEKDDKGDVKEVRVSSYMSVIKDSNVLFFAISIFMFHLANAAVLPLLGQMVGVGVEFRLGLPFIASCMAMGEITGILGAWLALRLKKLMGPKFCMVLGFSMLFPRCAAIVLVSKFGQKNIYALAATQLLDGFGGSLVHLTLIIFTNLLSVGTGRFSSVFGVVMLGEAIGAASSNLLGGWLAAQSFELAFTVLGLIAIFPVITFSGGVHVRQSVKKQETAISNKRLSESASHQSHDRSATPCDMTSP